MSSGQIRNLLQKIPCLGRWPFSVEDNENEYLDLIADARGHRVWQDWAGNRAEGKSLWVGGYRIHLSWHRERSNTEMKIQKNPRSIKIEEIEEFLAYQFRRFSREESLYKKWYETKLDWNC